jgi:hypothetical protein
MNRKKVRFDEEHLIKKEESNSKTKSIVVRMIAGFIRGLIKLLD